VLLALLLAPWLTPIMSESPNGFTQHLPKAILAALAGVLIGIGGFLGDLTMSAIKRDVGVKDTGDMLPGQGGVLDRIDSLIFTSPIFYYFAYLLYA
jgi:phosphatidate cytidylyltransferase